ncbi:MAG: homocysteine S-methyltransferase family protein [Dehalococcoidia bacterium]
MQANVTPRQAKLLTIGASSRPALYDGSKGVYLGPSLMQVGKRPSDLTEWLNLLAPHIVRRAHREYVAAGSQIIQTNSFNANRFRLQAHGLDSRLEEANVLAAQIAREAAGDDVLVAGVIGPSGKLPALAEVAKGELAAAFAEQARALDKGGADFFHIETMSDLEEAIAAVEGIRSVSSLPVALTMSFDAGNIERGLRTMMGVSPGALVDKANELNLFAVGANCGLGLKGFQPLVRALTEAAPTGLVIAKLNAGMPKVKSGRTIYEASPAKMADYALWCARNGVHIVGGCCGTTPKHIEAMARALNREL